MLSSIAMLRQRCRSSLPAPLPAVTLPWPSWINPGERPQSELPSGEPFRARAPSAENASPESRREGPAASVDARPASPSGTGHSDTTDSQPGTIAGSQSVHNEGTAACQEHRNAASGRARARPAAAGDAADDAAPGKVKDVHAAG